MIRILPLAMAVLLAGCGAPGLSGRGTEFQDPGGPVSLSRADWGSSLCGHRRCVGRCTSAACGVEIISTGVRMPARNQPGK